MHTGARQRTRFGNVVQPGMDAALSRQRARVQIPSFPRLCRSPAGGCANRQFLTFGQACSMGASCTCNAAAAGSIPVLSTMFQVHAAVVKWVRPRFGKAEIRVQVSAAAR